MSLGQARLLPGGKKEENKILWGRERTLHRFTGFVFKGRGASFTVTGFSAQQKQGLRHGFVHDFHAHIPFPTHGKGTVFMSRIRHLDLPEELAPLLSQHAAFQMDTSPDGQTSQLETPAATAAPQHLKRGWSSVSRLVPVPTSWPARHHPF